jgi:hypothetical protein
MAGRYAPKSQNFALIIHARAEASCITGGSTRTPVNLGVDVIELLPWM